MTEPSPTTRAGVAVVVATRDRPVLLRRTIESILSQAYDGPIEMIIVFDRSEPDESLIRSDPDRSVRITTNVNTPGLAGARNSGIALVDKPWVAFCDDDDEWLPGKLTAQMDDLERTGSKFSMTGSLVNYRGEDHVRRADASEVNKTGLLHSRIFEIPSSSFVIDTELVRDELGGIDEALPGSYGEDYDLMLRAADKTSLSVVEDPLCRVYWHGSSFFFERWKLIDEALEYMLGKFPEFDTAPKGKARIVGQRAIAQAEIGDRKKALGSVRDVVKLNWREPRWPLALLVMAGMPANLILKVLHRFGKGI
ncbi:MAG: glycosyltransferase family 2 protein [Acidimicrobiales bacterium]|nr:glycosyltransferase family 2 protein [Acidimicrobiales bacterium]